MSKKIKVQLADVNKNADSDTIEEAIQDWLINHGHDSSLGKLSYDFETETLTVPNDVGQALEEQKADVEEVVNDYIIQGHVAIKDY